MTREMIRQVIDAGTSVGANSEEAEYAASPRDQAAKLSIALKEVAETHYWLRLFKAKYRVEENTDLLIAEADELKKIFKARIRNLKSKEQKTRNKDQKAKNK